MLERSIADNSRKMQALEELKLYSQWVNYIFLSRGDKVTKPPINPNKAVTLSLEERLADATNPQSWGTYRQAVQRYQEGQRRGYKGIGFVFSERDPFTGIDLDHCRDKSTGQIAPWAKRIIRLLSSYTELSPREEGFHILIRADLVATADAIALTDIHHKRHDIEIYSADRYFTWTGKHLDSTPITIEDRQSELDELYFEVFCMGDNTEEEKHEERSTTSHTPAFSTPEQPLPEDEELLTLAAQARGSSGLKFQRLWNGDASDYRTASGEPDESRADAALLGIFAYWTGRDALRMERLFKRSGLYSGKPDRQRKWDARARTGETYGEGSVRLAIANCSSVYDPNWRPAGWLPYEEYIAKKHQSSIHQDAPQRRDEPTKGPQQPFLRKQTFPHDSPSAGQHTEYARGGQRR